MNGDEFEPASGRLFLCIELPSHARGAVARLQQEYADADGMNWVAPENLHVTLVFLGEVDPERQRDLGLRLRDVEVQPFFLGLEGVGVFPQKGRPQVLWAGLEKVDPRLFQLHGKVEQVALDLGFEPERRRYRPHVTIARCQGRAQRTVSAILKNNADFGTAPFQVNSFALYSSQLTSEGACYSRLREFPLRKV